VLLLCGALAGFGGTASAQQSNQAYFNEQAERQRQQAYRSAGPDRPATSNQLRSAR
jgi:hypothetical protein